jgi:hypothetical protein
MHRRQGKAVSCLQVAVGTNTDTTASSGSICRRTSTAAMCDVSAATSAVNADATTATAAVILTL